MDSNMQCPEEHILCSDCFRDFGLQRNAYCIGIENIKPCCNCKSKSGRKLTSYLATELVYNFFVNGTVKKDGYGAVPIIHYHSSRFGDNEVSIDTELDEDIRLLERKLHIGMIYYLPRLWKTGDVKPLHQLQDSSTRSEIIKDILNSYPAYILDESDCFFRLRQNPEKPDVKNEYDSPPEEKLGKNRLESPGLPVLYGSKDIEGCIHECRVSIEDALYLARLRPTRALRLLNLAELIDDGCNESESLDIAMHMLFFASGQSYEITRDIAIAANAAGFDGLIFPSYFSQMRNGIVNYEDAYGISIRKLDCLKLYAKKQVAQNIAVFGRPVRDGLLVVESINRLMLKSANYDYYFGPVLPSDTPTPIEAFFNNITNLIIESLDGKSDG